MKKVHTTKDIKSDPRIIDFIPNYDGRGVHMVECKEGWRFECYNSTVEIGSIKDLCYSINNDLNQTT